MPTFTVRPGIYLTPTGDPATATQRWHRNGVEIVGASGTSYTTASPADDGKLIEYGENVINSAGSAAEQRLTLQSIPFPKTIAVSGSSISTYSSFDTSRPFGPAAEKTTNGTFACRITLKSFTQTYIALLGSDGGPFIFILPGGQLFLSATLYGVDAAIAGTGVDVPMSLVCSWDGAGGLPGGKTMSLYAKIGANGWAEVASSTTTSATTSAAFGQFGQNSAATFDLSHWVWANYGAMDPTIEYTKFFNADGTVKDLGIDGTATGLPAPRLYVSGDDWGTASPLNNSGTRGDVTWTDGSITVINP